MPERVGKDQGVEVALARGARLGAMGLLLSGTLGISTAFGMLLLLPLYVQRLGGDEASFGIVMAAATIPAGLSIGLLILYPEVWRPNVVLTIAVLAYGLGAVGAALVTVTWVPLVGIGVLLGTAWAVVYAASPMVMSEMVTNRERAGLLRLPDRHPAARDRPRTGHRRLASRRWTRLSGCLPGGGRPLRYRGGPRVRGGLDRPRRGRRLPGKVLAPVTSLERLFLSGPR
jgi:hypothetical protein